MTLFIVLLVIGVSVILLSLFLKPLRSPHKPNPIKHPIRASQIQSSALLKDKTQQVPQDFILPKRALFHAEQDNQYQTKKANEIVYPYEKQPSLLSPAERSFFGVLLKVVAKNHTVFCKVRLADVIKTVHYSDRSKWQSAYNRIASKHVDFLICDSSTLDILYVIELDDGSHERAERQKRDDFVDTALGVATIPVLHIPVKSGYSLQEVSQALDSKIQHLEPFVN
jgi:Protein of unknown function (DUF2726)